MKAVNTYLNFKGTTEEAFNFYKSVFGGEFSALVRYKDMPQQPDPEACPGGLPDPEKLMHISLPLPTGHILMATDVTGNAPFELNQGNNFSIIISADDTTEGQKLYDALSNGGTPLMPFAPADWGGHWGMLTDRFGIQWMVDCE